MIASDVKGLSDGMTPMERVPSEPSIEESFDGGFALDEAIGRNPDLWLYRGRTIAMLKTYFRYSIEVGRLPSILGRELFRARVTAYRMASFEDSVIFVHDVESAIERLADFHQRLIALIVLQDYTHEQAADILRCARRTVSREFPDAVDLLSEMFLEGGLVKQLPTPPVEKTCQEGERGDFLLSDCKQAE